MIAGGSIYQKPYNKNIGVEEPNLTEDNPIYFLEEPFEITGEDLIPTSGSYGWFTTPSFQIPGNVNITYYAVWTGAASIYCDRMIMFNEFYDIMFNPTQKPNPVTPPNFGGQISAKYPTADSTLHSTYVDEPPLLAAEAFGKINHLVDSVIGARNGGMELNGAIWPHTEWGMRFEQKFGISPFDDKYKRKYLLYNVYPFRQELATTQADVQSAIEELINFRFIGDDPELLPYQFLGLRPAVRASKLYDDEPENDKPWISILQVHAEHNVYLDGGQYKIDRAATNMRRAPTRDEIFVQGNMALAYGAKGFMVYMVPTWNARPEDDPKAEPVWNTFGLFDELHNPYLGVDGSGLVQNPCNIQVPNTRYDAVKDLFAETKKIENVILNLNWLDAKGWNRSESCSINWINSVTTQHPAVDEDPDYTTFVETGFFEEKNPSSVDLVPPKYVYVVNRRCNTQEIPGDLPVQDSSHRYVSLKFNLDSDYKNYTIHDLKTYSVYYIGFNGSLVLYLKAGHGTLLKIEPTIQSGGTLAIDESVNYNIKVKGDVKLAQG
ncbi:hypothetical protein MASR1M107_00330 [Ignavibacteriales bacterium]